VTVWVRVGLGHGWVIDLGDRLGNGFRQWVGHR